ncbi:MAG: hypothetical protein AABX98_04355 [Nanoarchaeota archaeon]
MSREEKEKVKLVGCEKELFEEYVCSPAYLWFGVLAEDGTQLFRKYENADSDICKKDIC